jgi:hypothetical protein
VTDHVAHYACYRRGCRRDECRTADRNYRKRYELRRLSGIPSHIAGPVVAAHIHTLISSGHTIRGIARQATVSERAVTYILGGQQKVTRPKALALLAVRPLGENPRVDPTGTIRRIQALAVIGWPVVWVAEQAGYAPSYLFNIMAGRVSTVPRDVARRLAAVYREYSHRPGPSEFARSSARRNNWHGPAAWDEIDNPDEQPDTEPVVEAEPTREELAAIRKAEIAHLLSFNLSTTEIASRLHMAHGYVRDIARTLRSSSLEKAA